MIMVTEMEIIIAVSELTGIDQIELISPKKRTTGKGTDAQVICMAILRQECSIEGVKVRKMTHQAIADMFHKENHTSVCYAVKNYHNLMETNKYFRQKATGIIEGIGLIFKQKHNGQNQN